MKMMFKKLFKAALVIGLSVFWICAAGAQTPNITGNEFQTQQAGKTAVGTVNMTINGSNQAVPVNGSNPLPVTPGASSAATAGITPQVCGPSASTCALKTSGGGNLYGAYAQASSSVYLFIFNQTSAPTNGSTTSGTASGNLVDCIGPSTQPSINYAPGPPEVFSAGMYAALSSTACGTLTLTTGTIHGSVQ
jgi:hypothetical protein